MKMMKHQSYKTSKENIECSVKHQEKESCERIFVFHKIILFSSSVIVQQLRALLKFVLEKFL